MITSNPVRPDQRGTGVNRDNLPDDTGPIPARYIGAAIVAGLLLLWLGDLWARSVLAGG